MLRKNNSFLLFVFISFNVYLNFNSKTAWAFENISNIDINLSRNTHSAATCSKLLSPLSIQKTLAFVFSNNFEYHENNIIVSYKNLSNQNRELNLELLKQADELNIIIKKGLFKNLLLKLTYKQTTNCEITGHLSWKGEEKRFSRSILVYIVAHYFDKLMSFINRLS